AVSRCRRCCNQHCQARDCGKRPDSGRLSAGAHGTLVVHRDRDQSWYPVGREGDQRCRWHRWVANRADHPRHPKRPDQSRERRCRAHARAEGQRRFRPGQFRRVACGGAATRSHQHAAGPSLLGRRPGRPAEISDVLPQRAHQPADRRCREPLRGRRAQAQKGRGDQRTTGYGTASVNAYVPMLKAKGADVVYQGNVDAANPDLKPELLRMQSAGAEAIMPWSVNAGFLSRIINTRGQMGWDVPIVGQTTLGSGQTKDLLEKLEYWAKVYPNNFRNVCYAPGGKLPERTV